MKRLLLLFPLCLLLANTELRAQVYVLPTTDDDKQKLIKLMIECYQRCYFEYIEALQEKSYACFKYYSSDSIYCKDEYIRASAREEYERCLSFCRLLGTVFQKKFIP
jgi:hypothetical protein